MSAKAIMWAKLQRTRSPSAQLVLLLLADAASDGGIIYELSATELVLASQQSRASVYRRLRECEARGVFRREIADRRPDGSAVISGQLFLDRAWTL